MLINATNDTRIARADEVIRLYKENPMGEETDETLTDLLADLRHWAKKNGIDFAKADAMAQMHFEAEAD